MELPVQCAFAIFLKVNASKHWEEANCFFLREGPPGDSFGQCARAPLTLMQLDTAAAARSIPKLQPPWQLLKMLPLNTTQEKRWINQSDHCVSNPLTIQRGNASHTLHPKPVTSFAIPSRMDQKI